MSKELKHFAVMGKPISHSLSPFIHRHFAASLGFDLSYEKIEVEEVLFINQVKDFFAKGGNGLNITLPYKEMAYELADIVNPRAKKAKAANTLWCYQGKIYADNTDGLGLVNDLKSYLQLEGLSLLIIGAGGASRGIIQPLFDAKIKSLSIANRSSEKLKLIAHDFKELHCMDLQKIEGQFDLIIDATSAGINKESLNLPLTILKKNTFCYDLAYNLQEKTPFLDWAKQQGLEAKDGLGMLIEQAAEAFFIWHGVKPETLKLKQRDRRDFKY